MSIRFDDQNKTFYLTGKKCSYIFRVNDEGYLEHLYYGSKIEVLDKKDKNILTINRAAFLGQIMREYKNSIAVSGTHGKTTTTLISATILASGLATIIQGRGVGRIGSKVACIMGTDFTFVSPSISVGSVLGLPGIIGATILGAFLEIILSFFIKPLMKLFPPLVTGTVVCLIGLTLLPVSIDWAAGGTGSPEYGSMLNISIAMIVLVITLTSTYDEANKIDKIPPENKIISI